MSDSRTGVKIHLLCVCESDICHELVSDHDAPVTPVLVTLVSVTPMTLTVHSCHLFKCQSQCCEQLAISTTRFRHQSESMDQSHSVQSMLVIAVGAIPLFTALSVGVSQK
eukprot:3751851-Amphidinium_carterae.1